MEGPLPVCEKLFKNNKLCDLIILTEQEEEKYGKLLKYTFHDQIIIKDESSSKIGDIYRSLYNEYDKDYLSFTNGHLESSKKKKIL